MSFFTQSNGKSVQSTGNFESGGGLAPIPEQWDGGATTGEAGLLTSVQRR